MKTKGKIESGNLLQFQKGSCYVNISAQFYPSQKASLDLPLKWVKSDLNFNTLMDEIGKSLDKGSFFFLLFVLFDFQCCS